MAERASKYLNVEECKSIFRGKGRFVDYLRFIREPKYPHSVALLHAVPILNICVYGFEGGEYDQDVVGRIFTDAREAYRKMELSGHVDYHLQRYKAARQEIIGKIPLEDRSKYEVVRDLIEQELIDGKLLNVSTTRML